MQRIEPAHPTSNLRRTVVKTSAIRRSRLARGQRANVEARPVPRACNGDTLRLALGATSIAATGEAVVFFLGAIAALIGVTFLVPAAARKPSRSEKMGSSQ